MPHKGANLDSTQISLQCRHPQPSQVDSTCIHRWIDAQLPCVYPAFDTVAWFHWQLSVIIIGEEAVLEYNMEGESVMDMYHTEVPVSQRGKGVGGVLAQVSYGARISARMANPLFVVVVVVVCP